MSSLLYPISLPGLTYDFKRKYNWNTGVQAALSKKTSAIAYQLYPVAEWEFIYEFLRDSMTFPEIQTLVGLHNSMRGRFDTFLLIDPDFHSVTAQQFGTGDGTTASFQLTALYTPGSGAYAGVGAPEIVQNLNGVAIIYRQDWQSPVAPGQQLAQIPRINWLTYSQAWNTANWTLNACTTGAAIVAPDGTTTALLVNETTAVSTQHAISQTDTGLTASVGPWTLSAWVRGATRTQCFIQITENIGTTFCAAIFNLTGSGTVASVSTGANWSGATATITSYAGGWYRVTLTATKTNAATSITSWVGGAVGGNNSYTGVVGEGVYAWGMQLESFNGVGAYLPTTSATSTVTDVSIGATCIATFGIAPIIGALCYWTGNFYYRCRFNEDSIDWVKFMNGLWSGSKIAFSQDIL